MSELQELKYKLESIQNIIARIRPEYDKLTREAYELQGEIADLELEEIRTIEELINFNAIGDYDIETFNRKSKELLGEHSNYICLSGYWADTNQRAIRLALPKKREPAQKVWQFLETMIPFIKENAAGEKLISLFEHTLSENASYKILIKGGKFFEQKYCYGTKSVYPVDDPFEYFLKFRYYV